MSEPASSSFGGLKDFSVDAQRRMFIEQQERERKEAENKKESRKIKKATAGATGVALSGLMANMENGTNKPKVHVGDDDDDSIDGDDWSVNSEESFYVGIERADYAQPDNLEMYGEEKDDDDYELKEDRLGISRVTVSIINREFTVEESGKTDWDADIPIHEAKTSSLYDFMNGPGGGGSSKGASSKKDIVVNVPLIGSSLEWKEGSKLGDDDAGVDQVYQHKAAEGKMFIDKLVSSPSGKGGAGDVSTAAGTLMPVTPGAGVPKSVGGGGDYPVLSPMALFSPGITTPGSKIVEGENNGVRQMRERELRKEAATSATRKMVDLKKMIATTKDGSGKVDAFTLMKTLEKMIEVEGGGAPVDIPLSAKATNRSFRMKLSKQIVRKWDF